MSGTQESLIMLLKVWSLNFLVFAVLQVTFCNHSEARFSIILDCQKPLETGMCRGYFRKWGFKDGKCQQFVYGGCGGNGNNFNTEDECNDACVSAPVSVCELPLETGPCRAARTRFGYKGGKCVKFTYGGCRGNENNFATEAECRSTCVSAPVSVCELPLETGPCRAARTRFGYKDGKCVKFTYGGCRGNENNFATEAECISACGSVSVCDQPLKTGPCRAIMPRFGYKNGQCVKFIYGGCRGNENNFKTRKQCQKVCGGAIYTKNGK
ncbi:Papilin [Holothuria leucospilota]|uniref:Papilin n=1 Tax=Holothuria leucospilota TaxID=206669 RepID=A0A9Q1CP89_HOLLE|nr:Papilin [Holothuria leucospilota]